MIHHGSKVKFHYTLEVDQNVVDCSRKGEPMSYIHGSGQLIRGLEEQLGGREAGDRIGLDVPPAHAHGEWSPDAVRVVPTSDFDDPRNLTAGERVRGSANGKTFEASITDVREERVTLDLNHPLAGKTLRFDIEIVSVD